MTVVSDACAALSEQDHINGLYNMKGFSRQITSQELLKEIINLKQNSSSSPIASKTVDSNIIKSSDDRSSISSDDVNNKSKNSISNSVNNSNGNNNNNNNNNSNSNNNTNINNNNNENNQISIINEKSPFKHDLRQYIRLKPQSMILQSIQGTLNVLKASGVKYLRYNTCDLSGQIRTKSFNLMNPKITANKLYHGVGIIEVVCIICIYIYIIYIYIYIYVCIGIDLFDNKSFGIKIKMPLYSYIRICICV